MGKNNDLVNDILSRGVRNEEEKKLLEKMAEKFAAAALALTAKANTPIIGPLKAERIQKKQDKFDAREQRLRQQENKELDSNMEVYGWKLWHANEKTGVRRYQKKELPDFKIAVRGSKFSIEFKGVTLPGKEDFQLKDYSKGTPRYINPTAFCKLEKA